MVYVEKQLTMLLLNEVHQLPPCSLLILLDTNYLDSIIAEDSAIQATQIANTLRTQGHTVELCNITGNLAEIECAVTKQPYDLVFNLVESFRKSDRHAYLIPALLDTLGISYSGCGSDGLYVTGSKLLTKRILSASRIQTPAIYCTRTSTLNFSYPAYIVKSTTENASFGIDSDSVITKTNADNLQHRILKKIQEKTNAQGGEWYAEAFIDGREIKVPLLAMPNSLNPTPVVLSPAEICFHNFPAHLPQILDYHAVWVESSFGYQNIGSTFDFVNEDRELIETIKSIALRCWDALHLTGYARIDFRIDKEGTPWVIDANANPCLTIDAGFMNSAKHAGLTHADVTQALLFDGLNRSQNKASRIERPLS